MSFRTVSLPLSGLLIALALSGCLKKGKPTATTPAAVPTAPATVPTTATSTTAPADAPWGAPEEAPPADEPGGSEAEVAAALEAALGKDPFEPADRRELDDAVAMLTTKDANKAAQALERLTALSPKYPDQATIPYNAGVAWFTQGNEDQARKSWLRATEVDPAFDKAWLNLGLLNQRAGRTDLAIASFQSGLRYNERSVELQVALINAFREQKRYDEAIAQAKKALEVNSRAIPLFCNLAMVYLETDKLDLARFLLEKAQQQNGEGSAQLHATLGQVFYRQGYAGDAVAEFEKALAIDYVQMAALQFLGSHYLDNRAYAEALPLWERAAKQQPKDAGIHINLGISYRGVGRFDDAKREYELALQLDAKNPEPWRDLAVLYGDYMKSYDAAIDAIGSYRAAGGGPATELDAWVASIQKIKEKAEKARLRAEKLKKQEAEDAAEAAAAAAAAAAAPPEPPPEAPPEPSTPDPGPEAIPGGAVIPDPAPAAPTPDPAQPQPSPCGGQ